MKIPEIKKDETLAAWQERLAQELNLDHKMQEIISKVSKTAYIRGTSIVLGILKEEGRI
jgi:hypothetical protein